jgi:hypothetical protein
MPPNNVKKTPQSACATLQRQQVVMRAVARAKTTVKEPFAPLNECNEDAVE